MQQMSKTKIRTMLLVMLAGAVGAFLVGAFTPASAAPLYDNNQPAVAHVSVNGASCATPWIEVSGITRDAASVSLQVQQPNGEYAVVDNDSVNVMVNFLTVETYHAHAITEPGDQFIIRALPPERAQYRLVISGLDDSVTAPLVDVLFGSNTIGCAVST